MLLVTCWQILNPGKQPYEELRPRPDGKATLSPENEQVCLCLCRACLVFVLRRCAPACWFDLIVCVFAVAGAANRESRGQRHDPRAGVRVRAVPKAGRGAAERAAAGPDQAANRVTAARPARCRA